jgi:hypothetical protein
MRSRRFIGDTESLEAEVLLERDDQDGLEALIARARR